MNSVNSKMAFSFSALNYKQKGLVAEIVYLFVIGVLSPFGEGLQIWSVHTIAYSLSYVLINILQFPVIILFYRWYLPATIGKKHYLLFSVLLPVYFFLYGLNSRFGILAVMNMPFIPEGYRQNISGAQPLDFTKGYFNEYFGYTCLVLLGATSLYVIKLLFERQERVNNLETQKLNLELSQLKAQLQPHFFFNTINNMYALSLQHSPQTPKMINDLSGTMRYILYDARNEQVLLQQEIDFIKSFINLENIRHKEDNIIELVVQGETKNISVEPLLFLPFIENSFKHSLHADMPDKWVKLVLTVDENELVFQATNPKMPKSMQPEQSRGGIGLSNIGKRLELLYPKRHELVILDEAHTFTVILTISLKHD
jgi:two-component system, LytTR family, sensor kinase